MRGLLPQEVIRAKRDGKTLAAAQIDDFVAGLVDGGWSDAQAAALAMGIVLRGMDRAETVALTAAMTQSGERIDWRREGFEAPVLDKHSTGGIGDKVSLVLAPLLAACGALVPMVSGRGLGHTGGTLDKLEALPGYTVRPPRESLRRVLREAGCAIVGADATLAPADARLYAVRDVTATVESLPLITASILSKKLAAGVQGLVMDVKLGNGAFCTTRDEATALARSLVEVARGAGLPTVALLTDMNQPLGTSAGNALEVQEAIDLLASAGGDARLLELTLALAAEVLHLGGLAPTLQAARGRAEAVLRSGAAAENFARMVAALGGPRDVFAASQLPTAAVVQPVPAPRAGVLAAIDTRAVGLAVVALGGGRRQASDPVDPRVGFSAIAGLGTALAVGEPLAMVHAADEAGAAQAVAAYQAACTMADGPIAVGPVVLARED